MSFKYRYSGTYVSIPRNNLKLPAKVRDANGMEAVVAIYSEKVWHPHTIPISQLDCSIPCLGMIATEKSTVYVSRIITRGYKRGLNLSTLEIHRLTNVIKSWDRLPRVTDGPFLTDLYNPRYYDLETADAMLRNGERWAAPLNKNIALAVSYHFNDPLIYYTDMVVGYSSGGRAIIHPKFDFVGEELSTLTDNVEVRNV